MTTHDIHTPTTNDIRRFVYTWFSLFEHRAPVARLAEHVAEGDVSLAFPGGDVLLDRAAFAGWYEQVLENTVWNFHDLSNIVVAVTDDGRFTVGLDIDWQGGIADGSGWPANPDREFLFEVHQEWTLRTTDADPLTDPFQIVSLVATMR